MLLVIVGIIAAFIPLLAFFYYSANLKAIQVFARTATAEGSFPEEAIQARLSYLELIKYQMKSINGEHSLVRVEGDCLQKSGVRHGALLIVKLTQDDSLKWTLDGSDLCFDGTPLDKGSYFIYNIYRNPKINADKNFKIRQYIDHTINEGKITVTSRKYTGEGETDDAEHPIESVLGIVTSTISAGKSLH